MKSAHRLVGKASLIPAQRRFQEQVKVYERHTAAAGLTKMHGLRHRYAQIRYYELTGWRAPASGGPKRSELNEKQREQDEQARQVIAANWATSVHKLQQCIWDANGFAMILQVMLD